jgi:hypothetical protein
LPSQRIPKGASHPGKYGELKTKAISTIGLLIASAWLTGIRAQPVTLTVSFAREAGTSLAINPAVLKYDKDFAYSFTFDDGLIDAYTLGFKLLNGGYSPVDGNQYRGLYSTDGCGNRLSFRAGIAWTTANKENKDLHFDTPGNLSYHEAVSMHSAGWDFFNHSYNHQANDNRIDYSWQLSANQESMRLNTGILMRYCVPPSGDTNYITPALDQGMLACFTSNNRSEGFPAGVGLTTGITSIRPVFWRNLLTSDTDSLGYLIDKFDTWVSSTGPGKQKWWNDFTHRVDYSRTGASLDFPDFRNYFENIESKYGEMGQDNGWIASSAEVFEYLLVKDKISLSLDSNGNQAIIRIDFSDVPPGLRYYDLSLILTGAPQIESIRSNVPGNIFFVRKGQGYLINMDFPDGEPAGIQPQEDGQPVHLKGYPNPASNSFTLPVPWETGLVSMQITDLTGRSLPQPAIIRQAGLIQLDLTGMGYPEGVYLIRVWSGKRYIGHTRMVIE